MAQTSETDERIAEAEARAGVYRVLAQAFTYPEPEALAALVEEDLPIASAAAEAFGEEVAAPLAALGHKLAHEQPGGVARGFERTFGHVLSVDWPPYETAYTSRGIFQQANDLADIAAFYAAYGVEVSGAANERPDHISVELELMHLLTAKEAYALRHHTAERADGCLEDQRRFFEAHLGRWAPEFARRLAGGAAGTPYADLADLCTAFLANESRRLGAQPAAMDGGVEIAEPEEDACWNCVFARPDDPAEAGADG